MMVHSLPAIFQVWRHTHICVGFMQVFRMPGLMMLSQRVSDTCRNPTGIFLGRSTVVALWVSHYTALLAARTSETLKVSGSR